MLVRKDHMSCDFVFMFTYVHHPYLQYIMKFMKSLETFRGVSYDRSDHPWNPWVFLPRFEGWLGDPEDGGIQRVRGLQRFAPSKATGPAGSSRSILGVEIPSGYVKHSY